MVRFKQFGPTNLTYSQIYIRHHVFNTRGCRTQKQIAHIDNNKVTTAKVYIHRQKSVT